MKQSGTPIELYDVTLRDGAQGEGVSFSPEDMRGVAKALDRAGVAVIEGGNPGASAKDMAFIKEAGRLGLARSRVAAFGSTRRKGAAANEDRQLAALITSGAPIVTIFGKSSAGHAEHVLRVSLEENLALIRDSVAFLRGAGREVFFDAEHFFDGYKENPAYAVETLRAALGAGAARLVLCDTNGGGFPEELSEAVKAVRAALPGAALGIHCHNDMGLATACSIAAVRAGASQVQGTFTGLGERCGNASLCEIIPALELKLGYSCLPEGGLSLLTETARYVSDTANVLLPPGTPYVGASAFAHKAGMHVDGMTKWKAAFEHLDPAEVGNERRFLVSEMAGRSALLDRVRQIAPGVGRESPELGQIVARVKKLEAKGWQFETAEASLELLIEKSLGLFTPAFTLVYFRSFGEHPAPTGLTSSATVKIEVNGKSELATAEGDGPVHALDMALRRALSPFYPSMQRFRLIDYKVRVTTPADATAAVVRVLMNSTDGTRVWSTVGVSRDVIEASWLALCDSVEYRLNLARPSK